MIILLNGTSSSGKSSLAREIMHQSERPFLYYSIDHLINCWIDEKFVVFGSDTKDWFFNEHSEDMKGQPFAPVVEGPNFLKLRWDMIEAISVLIQKGYDLIIDEVFWKEEILEHYVDALKYANKVYMVKVICELLECERRENNRNDRFKGLARSLYAQVYHAKIEYDVEIDTTSMQAKDAAISLLHFIDACPHPQAFTRAFCS